MTGNSLTLVNQQPRSQCSTQSPLAQLSDRLKPLDAKQGKAELLACLTLVAPSGMTAEDRQAWVAVAKQTLTGIPGDLLQRGCKKARETCRFASEIVPTILDEVKGTWDWRKRMLAEERAREANKDAPRLERPTYDPIPREETQRIIREAMGGK